MYSAYSDRWQWNYYNSVSVLSFTISICPYIPADKAVVSYTLCLVKGSGNEERKQTEQWQFGKNDTKIHLRQRAENKKNCTVLSLLELHSNVELHM